MFGTLGMINWNRPGEVIDPKVIATAKSTRPKMFQMVAAFRPCVERLLNAQFSLKHIGNFVGHRGASSTQIYGKIAVEQLREVAPCDGEDVL
jgi:hypothetical protein